MPRAATEIDSIAGRLQLADAVIELVKAGGFLKTKKRKRRQNGDDTVEAAPAKSKKKKKKSRPAESNEGEE